MFWFQSNTGPLQPVWQSFHQACDRAAHRQDLTVVITHFLVLAGRVDEDQCVFMKVCEWRAVCLLDICVQLSQRLPEGEVELNPARSHSRGGGGAGGGEETFKRDKKKEGARSEVWTTNREEGSNTDTTAARSNTTDILLSRNAGKDYLSLRTLISLDTRTHMHLVCLKERPLACGLLTL